MRDLLQPHRKQRCFQDALKHRDRLSAVSHQVHLSYYWGIAFIIIPDPDPLDTTMLQHRHIKRGWQPTSSEISILEGLAHLAHMAYNIHMDKSDTINIKDAATMLFVSVRTIQRWINQGRFPNAFKLSPGNSRNSPYRIPRADFETFQLLRRVARRS